MEDEGTGKLILETKMDVQNLPHEKHFSLPSLSACVEDSIQCNPNSETSGNLTVTSEKTISGVASSHCVNSKTSSSEDNFRIYRAQLHEINSDIEDSDGGQEDNDENDVSDSVNASSDSEANGEEENGGPFADEEGKLFSRQPLRLLLLLF